MYSRYSGDSVNWPRYREIRVTGTRVSGQIPDECRTKPPRTKYPRTEHPHFFAWVGQTPPPIYPNKRY